MIRNIGVPNFVRTWCSTWQWSDLPLQDGAYSWEVAFIACNYEGIMSCVYAWLVSWIFGRWLHCVLQFLGPWGVYCYIVIGDGAMSLLLLWHSVQLGLGNFWDQNRYVIWFSIYWEDLYFRVYVIWASTIWHAFENKFDRLWWMWSLKSHFFVVELFGFGNG